MVKIAHTPKPKKDHAELMDSIYRYTRHVYDASRKYFLLGRDKLILHLNAQPQEKVVEVGCGTARNLVKMAEKYPEAIFYGLDASDEMLKTAQENLERAKQEYAIQIKQALGQSFSPQSLFSIDKPDKIVFSYSLSMIPPWRESIEHALDLLDSGGEIHIVDFGLQEEQPALFRKFLFWFLDLFHVHPEPELQPFLQELERQGKGSLEIIRLYNGYTILALFTKA